MMQKAEEKGVRELGKGELTYSLDQGRYLFYMWRETTGGFSEGEWQDLIDIVEDHGLQWFECKRARVQAERPGGKQLQESR